MGSDDGLPRRTLATYGRSRRRDDEETVPDSEDSSSRAEPRPPEDDDGNLPKRPIKDGSDESEPPRPPRAFYRSRKRAPSPHTLSYTSAASTEEVIPDSEENGRDAGSSDDEDSDGIRKFSASSKSSGLSDWKQKLRDIDTEYDMDDHPSGPHDKPSPVSNPKETSSVDPFGSPLTTHASSQRASHRSRSDELPSSPPHNASSSTNTTPQFVFGTPQAPSPTPPTSDGKPSPIPKTKTKGKAKGKTRPPAEVQEASIDDQLVPSPEVVHQTRRKEKQKKPKAPTKKELLEARRETARMRSDMRVSIPTEATRPLKITSLLDRFNKQPVPEARALQPHSSVSEIEAWPSSSSPSASASTHDHERSEARHAEPSQQRSKSSRRSVSPFHSNGLLAPAASKYKTVTFAPTDDPFLATTTTTAIPRTPKEADADEASSSDVEMPNIGAILADRQAREDKRTQQEILQQRKLAVLELQKKAPANAGDTDDSDDGLEVVPDTMHSVAREEAAARAIAGRTRPSAGRNTQLRFARVAPSPQRPVLLPTESPEKRMAAAARPAFLAPSARDHGTAAGRGKRGGGMTKAELQQVMLQRSEVQNEKMRREKEEEWTRRGGRVGGVLEDVGDKNLQALIEEALERGGGASSTQDGGDDDGDEDEEDGDYVPVERGSESPRPMEAQEEGHDDQKTAADEETAHEDEQSRRGSGGGYRFRNGVECTRRQPGAENAAEEDVHPPPLSLPDLPSPAFTSPWLSRHTAPDHGDEKENDPDVSGNDTDKENRAVVCHAPPSSAPVQGARVLFDDLLGARATAQPLPLLLGEDDPFTFTPSPAKAGDEALRRLSSPTPVRVFGASGKRGLSQMFEEEEDGAPTPQGGNDGATRGDGDPGFVEFKPALGSLSQAFEQTQGLPLAPQVASPLCGAAQTSFRSLLMHQAAALQPALEVDDRLRAEAAAIFEKEQEYVIQAAQPASSRPRRELYITENGCASSFSITVHPANADGTVVADRFLTQTRPEGSSSPLVYRPSPSQRPYDALLRTHSDGALGTTHSGTATSSPLAARQPLSTLAETSPVSSVGREPLRRLRRAQTSPEAPVTGSARRYAYPRGQSLSPSPSPSPAKAKGGAGPAAMMMQGRTAFSELMLGAKTAVHREGEKAKAKKRSEFVEDQAVESDEDDMLGFGGARKKNGGDEDEEGDEQDVDGVVKDLVDDAQMDESALAKSKVLEKHLEQQNEDDERLEKEVNDVVAGKRRTRRRRGGAGGLLGSDASDDESSDDEEARALRRRLAKKRRVEGDTLDALARDPATAPFHATYQMGLVDDADEFAHLDRDEGEDGSSGVQEKTQDDRDGEEGTGDGEKGGRGGDADDDDDVEMAAPDDAGEEQLYAADLRKQLQEIARGKQEYHEHDPEDVSWVDQDPDEGASALHMRVRMASSAPHKAPLPAQPIPVDADMDVLSLRRIHADEQNDPIFAQRMKRWANDEGASSRHHRSGTGNAAGAVTGHHRTRGATAAKSTRQPPARRGAATAPAPVRKTASALSAVADRSARFGG
ncbi:hypothetical protein EDB92DRAFT_2116431 [Lactarius akahatsu]|uniref:DNA replication checkpoint mediator MRC1 domain-containing protein n=1 Tax=Lactarius akahatsu TaxID=416441 RepID=A0AAD4QB71_9AGAM|nr:hypothetical protein EDB92DRAFT_2116431 [Lactarius akahatsu]